MYGFLNQGAKDLLKMQGRVRRTKRLRLSRRFRQRIYWRDSGKCVYCDEDVAFADATMDHVTPLVHRGRNRSKENIALSCLRCNQAKAQLTLEDPGDLSPDALWMRFEKTVKDAQTRKGHYCEWVAAHYQSPM